MNMAEKIKNIAGIINTKSVEPGATHRLRRKVKHEKFTHPADIKNISKITILPQNIY